MITNIELENLGTVNKNVVRIHTDNGRELGIWFSYQTPVSYYYRNDSDSERVTRQNDWSTTTGKFINSLCQDKKQRVSGELFMEKLSYRIGQIS